MMREVLQRRLRRGLAEGDLPHLIVVDGGKGQLNVALAAVADLGIDGVDVVALAKSRILDEAEGAGGAPLRSPERVFLPGVKNPIHLRSHTDELFLMTHLRDEAHRFAITFHRRRRVKAHFTSPLDAVPGVGPSRRRAILRHFGSLRAVRAATVEALASVPGVGQRLAAEIHEALH
jgi:excinuclease ABC subunit C